MSNVLLDALNGLGYVLDTPGALMRGALEGRPGERADWGLVGNLVADPLNLAMGGGVLARALGIRKALAFNKEIQAAEGLAAFPGKAAEPTLESLLAPTKARQIVKMPGINIENQPVEILDEIIKHGTDEDAAAAIARKAGVRLIDPANSPNKLPGDLAIEGGPFQPRLFEPRSTRVTVPKGFVEPIRPNQMFVDARLARPSIPQFDTDLAEEIQRMRSSPDWTDEMEQAAKRLLTGPVEPETIEKLKEYFRVPYHEGTHILQALDPGAAADLAKVLSRKALRQGAEYRLERAGLPPNVTGQEVDDMLRIAATKPRLGASPAAGMYSEALANAVGNIITPEASDALVAFLKGDIPRAEAFGELRRAFQSGRQAQQSQRAADILLDFYGGLGPRWRPNYGASVGVSRRSLQFKWPPNVTRLGPEAMDVPAFPSTLLAAMMGYNVGKAPYYLAN